MSSKNWSKINCIDLLKTAGYINIGIAIGHLVGLIWAQQLFEMTGIGEEMNELAKSHFLFPYVLTIFVSIVFIIFGLYGLSAAGIFKKLPFLKFGIFSIAAVYIFRGVGGFFADPRGKETSATIEIIYSFIALAIGILFLFGGIKKWNRQKGYSNQGNG